MAARNHKIRTFLTPGKKVHLVGIGGVSMRPLGLVLQGMGIQVTGSDMNASVSTDEPGPMVFRCSLATALKTFRVQTASSGLPPPTTTIRKLLPPGLWEFLSSSGLRLGVC